MRDYPAARDAYTESIRLAPDRVESYARLSSLLRGRIKNAEEADRYMEDLVRRNPKSSSALTAHGQYVLTMAQDEEAAGQAKEAADHYGLAAKDAAEAIKQLPPASDPVAMNESGAAYHLAASVAFKQRQLETARTQAQRGVAIAPGFVPLYLLLAQIEANDGQRAEAIQWVRRGLEHTAGQFALLYKLVYLLLDDRQTDEAERLLGKLRDAEQSPASVGFLEARLWIAKEQWQEAIRVLDRVRPQLWTEREIQLVLETDFWLAYCYGKLGNADQQLMAYRRIYEINPGWLPAQQGMATVLASLGRIDEAMDVLRNTLRLANAPPINRLQLAKLLILSNLRRNKEDRDWNEVAKALDAAEQAVPESAQLPILRAEALVAQDRFQEAEKLLTDARAKYPNEPDVWVALTAIAQRQQRWDAAEKALREAEQQLGDNVVVRQARARYLVLRQGQEAAAQIRELAKNTEKFSAEQRRQLFLGLAILSFQAGDPDQTQDLCRQISQADRQNLPVRLLLFDLARMNKNAAGMKEILEEIQRIEGEGPLWHYARAIYLCLTASDARDPCLQEAMEHLTQARAARPAWAALPQLSAEICDRRGDPEGAIKNYLAAIDLGERGPSSIRRVVQLLYERQRYNEADRALRRLEDQQTPFSTDLGRLAAEISLQLENFERALEVAKQVATNSKDFRNHIWFGQLLGIMGARSGQDPQKSQATIDQAEKEFRMGVQLAEKSPEAWVALIQFLVRVDRKEKAEAAIQEALGKLPGTESAVALAQCYEIVGRNDEAEKRYEAALAAKPEDAALLQTVAEFYLRTKATDKAKPLLARLLNCKAEADLSHLVWARRNLAMLALSSGGNPGVMRAAQLTAENLKSPQASLLDRRLRALTLASMPDRGARLEAVKIWEQVLRDQRFAPRDEQLTPDQIAQDLFMLAETYRGLGTQGDHRKTGWNNATRHMRTLLSTKGKDPRYVSTFVQWLIEEGDLQEAHLWLQQLQAIAPDSPTTLDLRIQWLLKQKHDEDLKQAETLVRDFVKKHPEQPLALAKFLARAGRGDEALAVLEPEISLNPDMIADAVVALLATKKTPEQTARCEKILAAALEKHKRPISLLLVQAELESGQQRFDRVEANYREILQKDPKNLVALNNLAMLLAARNLHLDDAEKMIQLAIDLHGPMPGLLDTRAAVYTAQGKEKEARADLQTANENTGNQTAMSFFREARIDMLRGDRDAAAKAIRNAKNAGLKPDDLHPAERSVYAQLMALVSAG
jgi:tetratricopeptide (TPR) repeat protein